MLFVNWCCAAFQRRDLGIVIVDRNDIVADLRKACCRYKSNVSRSDYGDLHEVLLTFVVLILVPERTLSPGSEVISRTEDPEWAISRWSRSADVLTIGRPPRKDRWD